MGFRDAIRTYLNPYTPPPERRSMQTWGDWTPSKATQVTEDTALTLSAVWACQTLIADAVANMPVDSFRKKGSGRVETKPPAFLHKPNPDMGLIDFETQRILSMLGWGESYCTLVRQYRSEIAPIMERWPLDPNTVDVIREDGRVNIYVDHKLTQPGDIQRVIGYRLPGHLKAMSPVRFGANTFGLGLAAEKYDRKFLENGAIASGVLTVPELPIETNADVVDRLREQFAQRHTSVENMHKPMVLTGGTTWANTTINPEDAQLLETRKFQVSDVARWFRVPPHMIGDVERSTSWGTGIEVQGIGFVVYTLAAWIGRLEEADSSLLPGGQFVKKNVNALVRGDMAARREWYKAGLDGAQPWLTVEEVRAWEELPPLEEYMNPPDPAADDQGDPNGSV